VKSFIIVNVNLEAKIRVGGRSLLDAAKFDAAGGNLQQRRYEFAKRLDLHIAGENGHR
jgi:hypothetical protein